MQRNVRSNGQSKRVNGVTVTAITIHVFAALFATTAIVVDVSKTQDYPRIRSGKTAVTSQRLEKDDLEKGSNSKTTRIAQVGGDYDSSSRRVDGVGNVR